MTNDNQDALREAERLEKEWSGTAYQQDKGDRVAAHLRRLVAENEEKESALKIVEATCDDFANQIEAKDALLKQAVDALEQAKHNTTHGQIAWNCKEAITAIRQHLEGRA